MKEEWRNGGGNNDDAHPQDKSDLQEPHLVHHRRQSVHSLRPSPGHVCCLLLVRQPMSFQTFGNAYDMQDQVQTERHSICDKTCCCSVVQTPSANAVQPQEISLHLVQEVVRCEAQDSRCVRDIADGQPWPYAAALYHLMMRG